MAGNFLEFAHAHLTCIYIPTLWHCLRHASELGKHSHPCSPLQVYLEQNVNHHFWRAGINLSLRTTLLHSDAVLPRYFKVNYIHLHWFSCVSQGIFKLYRPLRPTSLRWRRTVDMDKTILWCSPKLARIWGAILLLVANEILVIILCVVIFFLPLMCLSVYSITVPVFCCFWITWWTAPTEQPRPGSWYPSLDKPQFSRDPWSICKAYCIHRTYLYIVVTLLLVQWINLESSGSGLVNNMIFWSS